MKSRVDKVAVSVSLLLLMGWGSCTDPFIIRSIDIERLLVVEATLTDEMKRQSVRISNTVGLIDFGQDIESEAEVRIEDDQGNTHAFSFDEGSGTYYSDQPFKALPNVAYVLEINAADGRSYSSIPVHLPPPVEMDRVYPELAAENGGDQIHVLVDASNAGDARYFRYEYEETYKVVLPHPSPFRWEIINYSPFTQSYQIELTPRPLDLACYVSEHSSGIRQTSTFGLGENNIRRFPVRVIDAGDAVIKERYSILVKQYVQTLESYTFYKTLADLGNVESLLSQGQPGYVTGNISGSMADEKVLGYFEASSVSSQRIFFDYKDFELDLPSYFVECEHLISYMIGPELLKRKLEFENFQVFFFEEKPVNGSGPKKIYHISQSECTDCPPSSSTVKPDFWQE